jgi:hypothetical protein
MSTLAEKFDAAWDERQRKLSLLRCVDGHQFARRWSMHLGMWKACRGCGLIQPLPTLVLVR